MNWLSRQQPNPPRLRLIGNGAWIVSVALFVCLGCQSVTGSKPQTLVRVIDASTNAPAVDVSIGGVVIAGNVGPNSITNYAFLSPQQGTVNVDASGTTKLLAQTSGAFLDNQQHSIFIADAASGFATSVLTDQSSGGPTGYLSVRFLDEATNIASLDVYFVPDGASYKKYTPILTGLTPGTATAYINIPLSTYDLVLVPTGALKAVYTGPGVTYTGGQVRTILIVNAPLSTATTPVSVVVGDDVN